MHFHFHIVDTGASTIVLRPRGCEEGSIVDVSKLSYTVPS